MGRLQRWTSLWAGECDATEAGPGRRRQLAITVGAPGEAREIHEALDFHDLRGWAGATVTLVPTRGRGRWAYRRPSSESSFSVAPVVQASDVPPIRYTGVPSEWSDSR